MNVPVLGFGSGVFPCPAPIGPRRRSRRLRKPPKRSAPQDWPYQAKTRKTKEDATAASPPPARRSPCENPPAPPPAESASAESFESPPLPPEGLGQRHHRTDITAQVQRQLAASRGLAQLRSELATGAQAAGISQGQLHERWRRQIRRIVRTVLGLAQPSPQFMIVQPQPAGNLAHSQRAGQPGRRIPELTRQTHSPPLLPTPSVDLTLQSIQIRR